MIRRFLLALWTSLFVRVTLIFLATFLAGCLTHALVDRYFAAAPARHRGAVVNDLASVKMSARRDGDITHVFIENFERSEVTMTLDFSTVNLKSSVDFPYTATFAPGETEAFTLSPSEPDVLWQYSYTNYYKLGSTLAVPDDYVYSLPYAPGRTYRVSQGYDGSFSHKGSNKYAIDWQMPEGTPVRAARGGLVVKIKDDSDKGGSSVEFDRFNNYVLIRHSDGTLGHYCHLKKNGAKVTVGQTVNSGDVIALSGNTGFSSGAHLHFCVFKTKNGRERISIPVKFKDEGGEAITLLQGRKYKAPDTAAARTADAGAHPDSVVR